MKKIISSIIIVLCFTQITNAQAAIFALIFGDKVATENFNVGLEIGFPYNSISSIDNSSSNFGLNFGISGNIKLSEKWSMNPTIFLVSKRNMSTDRFSLNSSNASLNGEFTNVPTDFRINYIDMPIFFNYNFTKKPYKIGIAPQISFRNDATAIFNNADGNFEFNIKDQTESIDYGFITQVGYIMGKGGNGKEIHIQLRYYQGLADVFKNDFISSTNNASYLSLHVSVPFVKKEE
jgi:hypothetical protein